MEIDLEILDMLRLNVTKTERWSQRVGYEYDSADGLFKESSTKHLHVKGDLVSDSR